MKGYAFFKNSNIPICPLFSIVMEKGELIEEELFVLMRLFKTDLCRCYSYKGARIDHMFFPENRVSDLRR